jgi:adenylate cyclase
MFRFEGYTLDIACNSLCAADRDIALRPKSFEVLRYLLENANRVVTKHELMKAIWPNIIVTDQVLTHCVAEVRQAIGDGDQAIIKTIPRRGYRFAAPVVRVAADVSGTRPRDAAPFPLVGEGWGGGSGAFGTDVPHGSTPTPNPSPQGGGELASVRDRPSVAVLPFVNLSGDPQEDYFSDGLTEDITTELSRFSELAVIARNSAFQYKGKAVDIRQVGRELGARYVLEGSVRRSGGRLRISAQLIDATRGVHWWAERYDRELHDAFAVQDEVARSIVGTLVAHVNRAEIERALLKPPAAWEAYDYYLRAEALFLDRNRQTKASLYDARRLLEQCLAIDPSYARAAAKLSQIHHFAYVEPFDGDYLSPTALDRSLELAEKAVHLDPLLPQARVQLGTVLVYKGQHAAAIAEFERALSLNPYLTDYGYAEALMSAGEPTRAIEVLASSRRLNPFQPIISSGFMGLAHYMLQGYGEAVRLCREYAARVPNDQWSHVWLASAYTQSGQLEQARVEAAEVLRINPGFTVESAKRVVVYKDPKDVEHRLDGMRKAGLPET